MPRGSKALKTKRLRRETEKPRDYGAAEVAERAGVSVFTVSRVFSNSPVVAEETRTRVLSVANELGYRPNAAARALRTGRVEIIGLVLPDRSMEGEFYGGIVSGLQTTLAEQHLDLLISIAPAGMSPAAWMRRLVATGKCGALGVLMEIEQEQTASELAAVGAPVTVLNHICEDPGTVSGIGYVGFDNDDGVRQAVRHLLELGHRRIAFFGCPAGWQDARHRENGFRGAMAEAGLNPAEWILPCAHDEGARSGAAAVDHVFSRSGEKPTAIVCASDDVTLGALRAVSRWGKSVPRDISVVGFDDNQWTSFYTPAITTVRHTGRDLGLAAGQEIVARFRDVEKKPAAIILPTQLVVRESTGLPSS